MYSNMAANTSSNVVGGHTCIAYPRHLPVQFVEGFRLSKMCVMGVCNICVTESQTYAYLVLRVEAGVDDGVHVQVQVVVDAIRAGGWFVPR
jgi:hypothetical protein